ncbi:hypothetical protein H4N58_14155 [Mumia sp. ZJ1417]|uniref:hypothetical protein n=1 Tax=Mumia sp. ZJ1417 TaxID=2708082 RepID=UPI0014211F66|nr:hypothetical protein [Mumia sp. ZJ1417]QMW65339.1 hypothetical protein H4N58_14155 [Mumia sp. ZJ1417]
MPWIDSFKFDDDFQDFRNDPEGEDFWADRITAEVSSGHPLHGREWTPVAKYHPKDEVVVRHGKDVALVHLMFTRASSEHPPWPSTTFFSSADEFRAHFEYR